MKSQGTNNDEDNNEKKKAAKKEAAKAVGRFLYHPGIVKGTDQREVIAKLQESLPEKFKEAFHDDGKTDLVECFRAYRDVEYQGVLRPDHYPKMGDAGFNDEVGFARLFAVGYLKGIRETVYAE